MLKVAGQMGRFSNFWMDRFHWISWYYVRKSWEIIGVNI